MRRRILPLTVVISVLGAQPLLAQNVVLTTDLLRTVNEAEEKLVGLATALSSEQFNWRPGAGVRSVQEVLLHVAADNYFIPAVMGIPAPAATKIVATEFSAVQAFEKQKLAKDATITELKSSFEHLRKAMNGISETRMRETIKVFGRDFTVQQFMIVATTHLHEHLGQMIAYARSNQVVPPWSRGQ